MDKDVLAEINSMPDRLVLKEPFRPLALYLEAKPHFQQYETTIKTWENDVTGLTNNPTYQASESFIFLSDCVFQMLLQGKIPTKQMLKEAFVDYIDTILYEVELVIKKEQGEVLSIKAEPIQKLGEQDSFQLTMEETIEHAIENERLLTSFNYDYNMVRDTVSSNKSFNEDADGVLRSKIIDPKGNLKGKAELRFDTIDISKGDEATLWLNLVQSTINAFDELTADLLDIISHMWLVQEKDTDGYINFHSDEVLKLRHQNSDGKPLVIRERDRFKIMKRVAALSSIWLSMREDSVKVVNKKKIKDDEEYDFTTFHRMFDINSVKIAYDKKTGDPKGIYELKIKPAPILRSYFDASLQTFVPIDLKIIQYSYNNQRELKRLGRYLSYQWKIRTLTRTLNQAFKVKTILEAIDFPSSYNGVTIRERLEQTLDDLVRDKIIKDWYYKEPIDEERVGKRDWVRKYWSELSIMINPPKETIEINKQKFNHLSDLITKENAKDLLLNNTNNSEYTTVEETPKLSIDTPLSPLSVGLLIEALKLSIRGAAAEIGISHSTLIRYVSNEAKRSNRSVSNKLETWFKERIKNI